MKILFALLLLVSLAGIASAQIPSVKLEGQVVCCADCWAEEDRTKVEYGTAEDLLKAKSCVEGGDPTLLAVREGDRFTLYQLEQGKFRLQGKNWLEFVGKRVSVEGSVRRSGKTNSVRVDALQVLAVSMAERDAAKVVGQELELALKDLFGAEQRLSQQKGRIVVLNFWATYCVPCRREMPDLAAIQNAYAALGVQVIGASTDEASERAKVLQFIKETKINFPVWMGATTVDMVRFGLGSALPGTVIIGRDGRIAKVISGVVNQSDLRQMIERMLATAEATAKLEEPKDVERTPKEKSRERPPRASSVPS